MSSKYVSTSAIDLRHGLPEGLDMFDVIEGPGTENATRHSFGSIPFIAPCAILCGMDTCEDFVCFAKAREEWLKN